jgi:hypothetical protein
MSTPKITVTPVAKSVPFDNSSNGFVSTDTQSAIEEIKNNIKIKSGEIVPGSFSGNPKKATVTFITAFATNNYGVNITGSDSRIWSVESKTITGFTVNSNANQAPTGNVFWQANLDGEVL